MTCSPGRSWPQPPGLPRLPVPGVDFDRCVAEPRSAENWRAFLWHSGGTGASARSHTCKGRLPTGSQRQCRRWDGGQHSGPPGVGGAVPQTASYLRDQALQFRPAELRRTFARRVSSATEDTVVFALGLHGGIFITSNPPQGHGAKWRQQVIQQGIGECELMAARCRRDSSHRAWRAAVNPSRIRWEAWAYRPRIPGAWCPSRCSARISGMPSSAIHTAGSRGHGSTGCRAPSAMICAMSSSLNRRCLPMNVQGIARAAALARSQDSRILKISAASAGV